VLHLMFGAALSAK